MNPKRLADYHRQLAALHAAIAAELAGEAAELAANDVQAPPAPAKKPSKRGGARGPRVPALAALGVSDIDREAAARVAHQRGFNRPGG